VLLLCDGIICPTGVYNGWYVWSCLLNVYYRRKVYVVRCSHYPYKVWPAIHSNTPLNLYVGIYTVCYRFIVVCLITIIVYILGRYVWLHASYHVCNATTSMYWYATRITFTVNIKNLNVVNQHLAYIYIKVSRPVFFVVLNTKHYILLWKVWIRHVAPWTIQVRYHLSLANNNSHKR
jgi:hypothetical protein